ncbi:uncharacterized protein LOC130772101 [Actinidia eriantha]|uniref:uncharacterized protein LOC130772101 n=1 Tax=Actinidia eriantha TaxID=165200 RepID=UPI002582B5FF|nr:uncharacterized protein LOC130772101 [Actinidia eriantha]
MATSLPSFCSLTKPFPKPKLPKCPPVRSQSFPNDQGNSSNMVDANLSVLRERIREVKKRESMEQCFKHENGWNYKSGYDKHKIHGIVSESIELLGLVSSSLAFVLWNYRSGYDNRHKIHGMVSESIELLGLVSSSLGFAFLFGSFSIFLVSFVVHLFN